MSDVPRSTASEMTRCTRPMTDASSLAAAARILQLGQVVERAVGLGVGARGGGRGGGVLLGVLRGSSSTIGAALRTISSRRSSARWMSGARGDGRAHLVAGHDGDVVDGEDVGRVGHGDQQRAVVDEGDGDRLVALDRGRRDELGGVGVEAVVRAGRGGRGRSARRPRARAGPRRCAPFCSSIALGARAGALGLADRRVHRPRGRRSRGRRSRRRGGGRSRRGATAA